MWHATVCSAVLSLLPIAVCVEGTSEKQARKQSRYEKLGYKRARRAFTDKQTLKGGKVLEIRHFTEERGCIDPNFVPAEIFIDTCTANFMNRSSPEACSDPYFGGLPECCLEGIECKTCLSAKECDRAVLQCTQGYLESCDSKNSSNYNLSTTFRDRHDSCVRGSEKRSYWNHPGFVLRGTFVDFSTPISGLPNSTGCAEYCASIPGCSAFVYSAGDRTCQLKEGELMDVCDPIGDSKCIRPSVDIFVLDTERLYCSSEAIGCACSREFYYCMKKEGCVGIEQDVQEIAEYANLCVEGGCSPVQCGIDASPSEEIAAACANDFFACAIQQGSSCGCAAAYMVCMDRVSQGDAYRIDEISGLNIIDMCLTEGCAAADCGLEQIGCNATSLACGDRYLACKVSLLLSLFLSRHGPFGKRDLPVSVYRYSCSAPCCEWSGVQDVFDYVPADLMQPLDRVIRLVML